jgi:hypothetical protein
MALPLLLWSTIFGHWFRFIPPVIRLPQAFYIRYSCVGADGCSSPSDSAAHQPQCALSCYSHAPASILFQTSEKALHRRVPAVTAATHALLDTVAPEHLAEFNAGIVATLARVKLTSRRPRKCRQPRPHFLPCSTSLRSKSGLDIEARQPADWSLSDGILNGRCVA